MLDSATPHDRLDAEFIMTLSFVRTKRPESACTAGLTFLAAREPFQSMPLGSVVNTVSAAIHRGHYVLAVDSGRVVGFVVWAVTDAVTAQRWFAGEATPSFEGRSDGDTVVLMLGVRTDRAAVMQGIRHVGARYPGRRYLIKRYGRKLPRVGRFPKATRETAGRTDA